MVEVVKKRMLTGAPSLPAILAYTVLLHMKKYISHPVVPTSHTALNVRVTCLFTFFSFHPRQHKNNHFNRMDWLYFPWALVMP
jgi:hypothetical protein